MLRTQIKKGLDTFRNPSRWPDWNTNAKNLLATKAESMDEGDHLRFSNGKAV